jgi:hypothetical protein
MLDTPRLIPTADSSMSSEVLQGTPMTGIHCSKEVAEEPVFREVRQLIHAKACLRQLTTISIHGERIVEH